MSATGKKDFFISYTGADEPWATWVAGTLEAAGYTTIVQAWDFRPGENFVRNMDEALNNGERFIAVLSEKYLKSLYCAAEWTAAFTRDPVGEKALFIPVRVEDIKPEGLLAPRIYIDLYDKSKEDAEKALLDGVSPENQPRNRPSYPGAKRPMFPGELPLNNLVNSGRRRNPNFTGREKKLAAIHKAFERGEMISLTQAVAGLGGAGKTAVALEYAYRHAHKYDCVWWVNAATDAEIFTAYLDFAVRQRLVGEKPKESDVIEAVQNWMNQHKSWLFIFDNAESAEVLQPYLPAHQTKRQCVLITSRYAFWQKALQIDIEVFTPEETREFLEKATKLPPDEAQGKLAKELGYLPLALEQAAAYITVLKKGYREYLELFLGRRLEVLKKFPGADKSRQTVAATWDISIGKIGADGAARQLLNLCAFFAPDGIKVEWFRNAAELLPEPLQSALRDEIAKDDILEELQRYSLVRLNAGNLSLHRLLQEVIRDSIGGDRQEWAGYCLSALNKCVDDDFSSPEKRDGFLSVSPHIAAVTERSKATGQEEKARLYHFLGYGYRNLARYSDALKWHRKALAIFEKVLGKDHPGTAVSYDNIALVYHRQGDYPEALKWLQKALAIQEKVLGKEHPDTASSGNNIAFVYASQGNYPEALAWHRKALAVKEKVLGRDHPDTASSYGNIANVYARQGDYPEALEWNRKALAVREKALGKEHPDTAMSYDNIALVYYKQGDYPEMLEWNRKALAVREKALGKEHPDTAMSYGNIALVYYKQGDYPEALEWHRKELAVFEKVLGREHPDTAKTYNNIANVYDSQGDYPEALAWHRKALTIQEKVLGKGHPDTASTYNNIAVVYHRLGDYPETLVWFRKALAIQEKVLGKEHPDTAMSYGNIALVYDSQEDYPKALKWFRKALAIQEKVLGKGHPDTAAIYEAIAFVYDSQGDYPQALVWFRKALQIWIRMEHPHTQIALYSASSAYEKAGLSQPFEEWLQEAIGNSN
jgi:tetratricopeptide (TPR) repeat protein